jgi:hypothetical protein
MKTISKTNKSSLVLLAALVCMIAASSVSALAVLASQVFFTQTRSTPSFFCSLALFMQIKTIFIRPLLAGTQK